MIKFLGTAQKNNHVIIYYLQDEGKNVFFKAATSNNNHEFKESNRYVFAFDITRKEEQNYEWESVRFSEGLEQYILTYKESGKSNSPLKVAISSDLNVWYKIGECENITETASIVPGYQHNESNVMYTGEKEIKIAHAENLITWNLKSDPVLSPREDHFDKEAVEIANTFVLHDNILVLYYSKKNLDGKVKYSVGAAYFDGENPDKLIWRSEEPIYDLPEEYYKEKIKPIGINLVNEQLILYWSTNDSNIFSITCPIPQILDIPRKKIFSYLVSKVKHNPIIAPRPEVPWESRATFNSAALFEDDKVHFLYRALGDTDLSVLGYATSKDGINIDYRADMPAYIPREPFETPGNNKFSTLAQHFMSGGYGGVEDPRITRIDDKVYLTYVAFDGATPPRVAISSIGIDDFLKNDWEKWESPKLISAPGMVNKSAVVFPRKVNGKYVVLHRVYPNILVDYLDDLNFDNYLQGHHFIPPRKGFWDSKKVGAGAPPIETDHGWLLVYQSVGYQDPGRYKIGAMMLDKDNPSKVLYRTHMPIIEPEEHYENNGFKAGVVYPCGAVIMDGKLNIYYGGSDSYLCAATADAEELIYQMKHNHEPKVHKVNGAFYN